MEKKPLNKWLQWLIVTVVVFVIYIGFAVWTNEWMYISIASIISFVTLFIVDDEEDEDVIEAIKKANQV